MTILHENTRKILIKRCLDVLNSRNFLSSEQQTEWINYRNALQDLDTSIESPVFPVPPTEPTYPITAEQITQRTRQDSSKPFANSIPNWATWTQNDWTAHFDANLSDAQADLVTSFPTARVMIKRQNLVIQNLVRLIIAMRDEIWPDLPD